MIGVGLSKLLEAGDVFAKDVELKVDNGADADVLEIGMFHSVRNDGYLESALRRIANGERHAVNGDRTLVDGEVAATRHLWRIVVLEGEIGGAVGIVQLDATSGLVYVALDDMAVETSVHQHGTLNVHLVANLQQSEVGTLQSLLHGGDGVSGLNNVYDGEADAIVSDALVYFQFVDKGAGKGEVDVFPVTLDSYNGSEFFDDA